MAHRQFRHEADAEARRHHCLHPVVALAAIDWRQYRAALAEDGIAAVAPLAIDPRAIALAVEIGDGDAVLADEGMLGIGHDHKLLAIKRQVVEPLIGFQPRQAVDRHLKIAADQPLLQDGGAGVQNLQFDGGMARLHCGQEGEKVGWRDGAHHAELQHHSFPAGEIGRAALYLFRLGEGLLQIRFDDFAQLREVRVRPLAVEERPAKLRLQQLDRPCQRGLRDVAALRRAGEVQFPADGQEVADLMHLHSGIL